ncbi:unnamed protein product, partial [Heterotrigona itama]
EESHSMLGYHSVDHAKTIRLENVCEDIENNNNEDKNQNFDDKHDVIHYSLNSKGIFAQCLVSGAVLLLAAGGGMPIGYSAILLPQLIEENGTMHEISVKQWGNFFFLVIEKYLFSVLALNSFVTIVKVYLDSINVAK